MTGLAATLVAAVSFALGVSAPRLTRLAVAAIRRRRGSDEPPEPPRRRRSGEQVPVSQLKASELRRWVEEQSARDREIIALQLRDVADSLGASEAIFWRWDSERDRLVPVCWSSGEPRPRDFRVEQWSGLLQWTAQERRPQFEGEGDRVTLASAPVLDGERLIGVISVTHPTGITESREQLRAWLPRHAAQIAQTVVLCETSLEARRHTRQAGALLLAVRRLQQLPPSAQELCQAICDTAVEASSATAAALVRWSPKKGTGQVVYITSDAGRRPPFDVSEDSVAAQVCRSLTESAQDFRMREASVAPVFYPHDNLWTSGSLLVMPIKRDGQALGAIVVYAQGEDLSQDERENLRFLATAATTSLEGAWNILEVERKAATDPLTGIGNRRHLEGRMGQALAESDRFGHPTSLILVDLDHFKKVNDTWGHEAGDQVLKRVAQLLREHVRQVDTCVRFGGEEMALLLPQTPLDGAIDLADRLRRSIAARPIFYLGTEIPVTASFGVACYPDAAATHDALLTEADKALYEAKHAGRNCVKSAAPRPRKTKA